MNEMGLLLCCGAGGLVGLYLLFIWFHWAQKKGRRIEQEKKGDNW